MLIKIVRYQSIFGSINSVAAVNFIVMMIRVLICNCWTCISMDTRLDWFQTDRESINTVD